MSLDSSEVQSKNDQKTGDVKPGANGNAYEIRSVSQLQFINWNYGALDATTSILSPDWEKQRLNRQEMLIQTEVTIHIWFMVKRIGL